MEIKGPGSHRPIFNGKTNAEPVKKQSQFEIQQKEMRNGESAANAPLSGVRSSFVRADLKSPEKRGNVIRAALSEVLERDVPGAKVLSKEDRARLIDWMADDPLIQTRVTNHLERTME
jgi:hypothetical protein